MELHGPCYGNDRQQCGFFKKKKTKTTFPFAYRVLNPPPHHCYLNNSIKILGDSTLLISFLINSCTKWGWVGNPFPAIQQFFFFFSRGLQAVSNRGKKQQNPGHVGPPVVLWAGGGILPFTAGMPVVTNAFTPCSLGSAHPMVMSFLKHLVVI